MRHLLGGVAIAALIATGIPAMAQTSTPQSGATTPSDTSSQPKAGKHHGMQSTAHRRSRGSSQDNMAEDLNRQELQRITQGAAPTASGTSQGTMPQGTMPGGAAPRQ